MPILADVLLEAKKASPTVTAFLTTTGAAVTAPAGSITPSTGGATA